MPEPTDLLVCVKCQTGAGRALAESLDGRTPDGVTLRYVECLGNCKRGCSIGMRGPGRWSYVYGNFAPDEDPEVILEGVRKYHATEDGLVPWKERPEHFKRNCIARVPPMEAFDD